MGKLWTIKEVAEYLRLKQDTIYKKVRKGEIPVIRLGNGLRFDKDQLDKWLASQVQTVKEGAERLPVYIDKLKKTKGDKDKIIKTLKEIWTDISKVPKKVAKKKTRKSVKKKVAKKKAATRKSTTKKPASPQQSSQS